nr:MAG TPA: hypothetical protein [Bacteriophage sp.]
MERVLIQEQSGNKRAIKGAIKEKRQGKEGVY